MQKLLVAYPDVCRNHDPWPEQPERLSAVGAAHLSADGERVAIIDWDVHHGNGTQDIFWNDPSVLYASIHQSPMYPGTGAASETDGPAAEGLTIMRATAGHRARVGWQAWA